MGIVGLGCWAGVRRKDHEGDAYFLGGRTLTWPVIGAALFASNISTVHMVSLAECGYKSGLLYGNFEWMAPFTLICLSLFFAPFYIRSNVTTLPDFLEKRYSRASRDWLTLLSIVAAIVIHIGFAFYAGARVLARHVRHRYERVHLRRGRFGGPVHDRRRTAGRHVDRIDPDASSC